MASEATLPETEMEALRAIAKTLGKTDWDFSLNPCVAQHGGGWQFLEANEKRAVTCNCTLSECHVISIYLKSQNLSGTLPKNLDGLPFLADLDLTRNYLSGSIPPEWGSTNLVNISLNANRLTGLIPKELGMIVTLANLTLEYNQFSGPLPHELGKLSRLERFCISSNYFNGTLPSSLGSLTNLKDFRIPDNQFQGKIPNFIQNWRNLERLDLKASGLEGPIPSSIGLLKNMKDLEISDLNGPESPFPPLDNMTKLEILILRSCNIVGELPYKIGKIPITETLDLSFNRLTGKIPKSYAELIRVDYVFLTGNLLTGNVPDWRIQDEQYYDLSYNNFATESLQLKDCQQEPNMNLFASSSKGDESGIATCSRNDKCNNTYWSLHINCGGAQIEFDQKIYEGDLNWPAKPASFFPGDTNTNLVASSTGEFVGDARSDEIYTFSIKNSSSLQKEIPELYKSARLSPLSLTYYGFCLMNGSYNVSLHFVELIFAEDETFASLGRRFFDVYIQGKKVSRDFNIAKVALGVGRAVTKSFNVSVIDGTLEIRFYWAGKGTTGIPLKGTYGPLISAISVEPNFPSRCMKNIPSDTLSAAVIAGIVAAVVFLVILLAILLYYKGFLRIKDTIDEEFRGLHLQVGSFTLREIKSATENFSEKNKIGEGGFGSVYKGLLPDGTIIAVKQLSSKSRQGTREFVTEIGMISALQHPHLVKLYGCCVEGSQLSLIYEYMENNSLASALFGAKDSQLHLDWSTRLKICIGIARGLAYLHEESRLKIVHRDIKATNVLLDANLNPKISDFGLAKLDDEENTHISTRIAGTYGYMAPEYVMHGYLTDKADVYSFGIVVLEIVSGRSNTSYRPKEECFYLLDWARVLKEKDKLLDMVDPRLGPHFNEEEVTAMINVALLCTSVASGDRPQMSSVVSMLEGKVTVTQVALDLIVPSDEMKTLRKKYSLLMNDLNTSNNQLQSVSTHGPSVASSSTTSDLYPIMQDSDYLVSRD